jgi:hypothetical protein
VPVRLFMKDQFRSDLRVGKVTAPVLVVHGEDDAVVPVTLGERAAVLPKGVLGALQVGRMMMAVPLRQHLDRHSEEARRLHVSTPACISQVAAVCLRTCGVTSGPRLASVTALLKAFPMLATGALFHSTANRCPCRF